MNKAFTLLELMVSILIMTVMVFAIYSVLNIAGAYFPTDTALLDLQQQARQTIEIITKESREASLSSISIAPIDVNNDVLMFSTPSKNGVSYYVNPANRQLIRQYPAGTMRVVANSISSLKFSLTGNLLVMTVQTQRNAQQKTLTFQLKGRVRVRNEP